MPRDALSRLGTAESGTQHRLVAASQEVVAGRLAGRETDRVEQLGRATRAHPGVAAVPLLEVLGRALGTAAGKLLPREPLEPLFHVSADELPPELRDDWLSFGADRGVDPLALNLLRELAELAPREEWGWLADAVDPRPVSDRDWIEVMLGLRVDEWVRTWAPAVREQAAGFRDAAPATPSPLCHR